MFKKLLLASAATVLATTSALAEPPKPPETSAASIYIMDADTGSVLYHKDAADKRPTASLCKIMTAYVAFDMIKSGKLSLDDTFIVSEKAWRTGGSRMFIEVGSSVTLRDLLHGLIIQSGNDAAVAIAEGIAGSVEGFADLMNEAAADLGMANSNFVTPHGLDRPEHYSTAEDLAILADAMIDGFPGLYEIFGKREFTYNDIKQFARNPLLKARVNGVDGLKTGFTNDAGYGLVSSAERYGRRIIMSTMGFEHHKDRATQSRELLEWAFRAYENVEPLAEGYDDLSVVVLDGVDLAVPVAVAFNPVVTVPRGASDEVSVQVDLQDVQAPVRTGEVIGQVTIAAPNIEAVTVDLVAKENVAEAPWYTLLSRKIGSYL